MDSKTYKLLWLLLIFLYSLTRNSNTKAIYHDSSFSSLKHNHHLNKRHRIDNQIVEEPETNSKELMTNATVKLQNIFHRKSLTENDERTLLSKLYNIRDKKNHLVTDKAIQLVTMVLKKNNVSKTSMDFGDNLTRYNSSFIKKRLGKDKDSNKEFSTNKREGKDKNSNLDAENGENQERCIVETDDDLVEDYQKRKVTKKSSCKMIGNTTGNSNVLLLDKIKSSAEKDSQSLAETSTHNEPVNRKSFSNFKILNLRHIRHNLKKLREALKTSSVGLLKKKSHKFKNAVKRLFLKQLKRTDKNVLKHLDSLKTRKDYIIELEDNGDNDEDDGDINDDGAIENERINNEYDNEPNNNIREIYNNVLNSLVRRFSSMFFKRRNGGGLRRRIVYNNGVGGRPVTDVFRNTVNVVTPTIRMFGGTSSNNLIARGEQLPVRRLNDRYYSSNSVEPIYYTQQLIGGFSNTLGSDEYVNDFTADDGDSSDDDVNEELPMRRFADQSEDDFEGKDDERDTKNDDPQIVIVDEDEKRARISKVMNLRTK